MRTLLLILAVTLTCSTSWAQSDSAAITVYLPFAPSAPAELTASLEQTISELASAPITVKIVSQWEDYLAAVRQGSVGSYLTAPHFTSWLVHNHQGVPVARYAGTLSYTILSRARDHSLFAVSDLAGRVICSQPTLNLDFLFANSLTAQTDDSSVDGASASKNAANVENQQARLAVTRSIAQRLTAGDTRCDAFAVSEHLALATEQASPDKWVRLIQSKEWPQYALVLVGEAEKFTPKLDTQFAVGEAILKLLHPVVEHELRTSDVVPAGSADYPQQISEVLTLYW